MMKWALQWTDSLRTTIDLIYNLYFYNYAIYPCLCQSVLFFDERIMALSSVCWPLLWVAKFIWDSEVNWPIISISPVTSTHAMFTNFLLLKIILYIQVAVSLRLMMIKHWFYNKIGFSYSNLHIYFLRQNAILKPKVNSQVMTKIWF